MSNLWEPIALKNPTDINLDNLFDKIIDGKIPVIIIRNFFTEKYCKEISIRIEKISNQTHGYGKNLIGMHLTSYHNKKLNYFDDSKIQQELLQTVFDGKCDPRKTIFKKISSLFNSKKVRVATEGKKKYSAGTIRIHHSGEGVPLHRDNVNFDTDSFLVSELENQISCVWHIQSSESGGDLKIFKKKWTKNDEKFREPDFGYSKKVVFDKTEFVTIYPKSGDLVIINPRFYHEVTPVTGNSKRITLGMFFGFVKNSEEMLAWA